jgi:hypothetical protein
MGGLNNGSAAVPACTGTATGTLGLTGIDNAGVAVTGCVSGVWVVRRRLVGILLPRGVCRLLVWRLLGVSLWVAH